MNEDRRIIVQLLIAGVALLFAGKLLFIQVLDDDYKLAAQNNVMKKFIDYPLRGMMTSRDGELLVVNNPVYDITVVAKEFRNSDTLALAKVMGIEMEEMREKLAKLKKARSFSWVKPQVLFKQLSPEEFAKIEVYLDDFSGIYVSPRTVRGYQYPYSANSLGYIGEITDRQIKRDTTNYYKAGDYIGRNGIESTYEEHLRGQRGISFKMVNVRGIVKGSFQDGEYDTLSVPGNNLTTTLDLDLQAYAEKLMEGKIGSLVAIEPSSGEILAIVSAPDYDPSLLSGRSFGKNMGVLQKDSLKPLFNRPIMAAYPPGSIFKVLQSLVALQEGVIAPGEFIYCDNKLIGDHAPPGRYDTRRALKYSSNNFYVKVFREVLNQRVDDNTFVDSRLGLDKWVTYMSRFGLGSKLGIDLPGEKSGFIPNSAFYDRYYGRNRWKASNVHSLAIGQGEILVTPIQMANMAALVANRGYFYTPHLIKDIGGQGPLEKYLEKHETGIQSQYFDEVIAGMEEVIQGTATRAYIKDLPIAGKTGTVQNPHGPDHSVFMAFAPVEQPQIAISVYVENAGWGGRAATAIAGLMLEKYVKGEISRPYMEKYVLKGDFLY
ncbi:penicillin-binding protein 2 [Persicobacter sp. CCB-QB2]|uniref:penicillin-binding protein 2 n=1 Tax=Persicobacter sp. CCB-QB2 TaxID=1561025 RepID=UPI0006A96DB4|nr:penicillin-binding protein 2 [Persicobacter sp. CCB-QB2]